MSDSRNIDRTRLRQLQAIAENLCTQAKHHRQRKNYAIADALYRNALAVAQKLDTPEYGDKGKSLIAEIQKDRQALLELMQR